MRARASREARASRAEHLDEGEPVVGQPHRLRALQMCVARQHRVEVLARRAPTSTPRSSASAARSGARRRRAGRAARSVATWSLRLRPVWSLPATRARPARAAAPRRSCGCPRARGRARARRSRARARPARAPSRAARPPRPGGSPGGRACARGRCCRARPRGTARRRRARTPRSAPCADRCRPRGARARSFGVRLRLLGVAHRVLGAGRECPRRRGCRKDRVPYPLARVRTPARIPLRSPKARIALLGAVLLGVAALWAALTAARPGRIRSRRASGGSCSRCLRGSTRGR